MADARDLGLMRGSWADPQLRGGDSVQRRSTVDSNFPHLDCGART